MQSSSGLRRRQVCLIGGGHTHALAVNALRSRPFPGANVTLVAAEAQAPYSGLLPGFVAGHYVERDLLIDLPGLCRRAGVELRHARAVGIDRVARQVILADGPPIPFDVLSINVGVTPKLDEIAGADEYGVAVKPVSTFAGRWRALESRVGAGNDFRIAIVGGGAAGVELALAVRHRFGDAIDVALATGGEVLGTHVEGVRRRARRALRAARIVVRENSPVVGIDRNGMALAGGEVIPADAVLLATDAAAPAWLASTGLRLASDGSIAVRDTLQSYDDDAIFAVGDCASVIDHPRPKAGVFAVRQAPPLVANIRRVLVGEPAESFTPQMGYLALISLGDKRAIAARGPLHAEGRWAWRWKDRIDRGFMRQFED